NKGVLDSYLIEISADILGHKDAEGGPLIDNILDAAGQKGTGKWTGVNALELGIPLTLIGEAVFARCLSAMKGERVRASELLDGPASTFDGNVTEFVGYVRDALYASKIISYAQGYMLMRHAAKE
ncbi:MAG: NADP-dependent phosphogluconate dehydrogenase, partial [Kiritimatiellia bacterium]